MAFPDTSKNYVGYIIGNNPTDGKPVVVRFPPSCWDQSDITGDNQIGHIIGTISEKPVMMIYKGDCPASVLQTDENYIGHIIGLNDDGKPVVMTECLDCAEEGEPPIIFCECEIPSAINMNMITVNVPAGIDFEYTGVMNWGTYVYSTCDCYTCNEDEEIPCDCTDFEADPYFSHYCIRNTINCYACYEIPVTGWISEPITVPYPNPTCPELDIIFVVIPVCNDVGDIIGMNLVWYYLEAFCLQDCLPANDTCIGNNYCCSDPSGCSVTCADGDPMGDFEFLFDTAFTGFCVDTLDGLGYGIGHITIWHDSTP